MSTMTNYKDHTGKNPEKYYKTTIHQSEKLMIGLNCLEPGQIQTAHTHSEQDKFYYVIEGQGDFIIGKERETAHPGNIIWAPAGVEHGVTNTGNDTLVILLGIAPAPM